MQPARNQSDQEREEESKLGYAVKRRLKECTEIDAVRWMICRAVM